MGQKFQKFGSRTVIYAGDEPQLMMTAFRDWPKTPAEATKAPYIRVFYLSDDGRRHYLPGEIDPLLACCDVSNPSISKRIPQILHGDEKCPYRIWKVRFSPLSEIVLECYNIETLDVTRFSIQSPPCGKPWLKCLFQLISPNESDDRRLVRRYCCLRRSRKGNPLMRIILWEKEVGGNPTDSALSFKEYRHLSNGNTQWCNYRLPFFANWREHLSIEIEDLPHWEEIAAEAERGT